MHITLLIISLDNYKNLISNYKICVMRKLICIFIILVSILPKLDAQTKARLVESEEIKSLKDDTYIDVKITTFIFKKYDENKRLAEFTQLDALKLERFFMGQAGVLSCESEAINKRMTINSRKELADGEIGLQPKEVINELLPMGYAVVSLQTSEEEMLFTRKKCTEKEELRLARSQRPQEEGCDDCGEIEVRQEILDKFKDVDYGSDLIDFGSSAMDASTASDE